MDKLQRYGLVRFNKNTGKIDTTLTAIGSAQLKMWALMNTTKKSMACVIVNIDERKVIQEVIGTDDYPEVEKDNFNFEIPEELYNILAEAEDRGI